MDISASLLGLGTPELAFIATIIVIALLVFVIVKGFMKGYKGYASKK